MSTMEGYITEFVNQIKRAVSIAESVQFGANKRTINNVLLSGLGGSGIGASIVSDLYFDEIKVPITVNKNYHIPAFVGENSLVIITSYSGNTEETISAMMQAHKRNALIVCVSSGGVIQEYAATHGILHVKIDDGMPPRACLGLSFIQLLYILHGHSLISNQFKVELSNVIEMLDSMAGAIQEEARDIAHKLHGTIPVIYSESRIEGVAIRFRQQLNENSKMLAWHNVVPEMNHNELVGWTKREDDISVVFLRNADDYPRNQERMNFTKGVVSKYTDTVVEIYSKGETLLERSFYLINICDWISYYLAEINEVDAIEINVINSLKNKLAENPL